LKVIWTPTAEDDLNSIFAFISHYSNTYAAQIIDSILQRAEQISAFPQSGRMVAEFNFAQVREVIEGSYRIIYHIKPDQIDVVAVIHSARDPFRNLDEEN
jgi:addiction module RelE/StbE family toxin